VNAETEPKPVLDVAFGLVLVGLMAAALQDGFELGPVRAGPRAIFTGLYIQALGGLFLLSYWFSQHSYMLKFLMWLCETQSTPRGRWTAILWGLFCIGVGAMPVLIGLGIAPSWLSTR
jgi:hypothetical protein